MLYYRNIVLKQANLVKSEQNLYLDKEGENFIMHLNQIY